MRAERRLERAPLVLLLPALLALTLLCLPLAGILGRASWSELPGLLTQPGTLVTLRLSLVTASVSALLCVVLGVPLAWLLARGDGWGTRVVRGLVTVPLVLPPVVGGIALLAAFGRRGLLGGWLADTVGVTLPFTTTAAIMAQTFVAMPFLVISVEGALAGANRRVEGVAATLGASSWTTFRRVTLPALAPAILAGAVLSWARALGEFGATITFAGNFPGTTRTLPLAAYSALNGGAIEDALGLSVILLTVAVLVLVGLRRQWLTR